MHACGTVKANRGKLPKSSIFKKKGPQLKARGVIMDCRTLYVDEVGTIYFTAWQDSKPVHMLSTFKTQKGPCQRNSSDANGEVATSKLISSNSH